MRKETRDRFAEDKGKRNKDGQHQAAANQRLVTMMPVAHGLIIGSLAFSEQEICPKGRQFSPRSLRVEGHLPPAGRLRAMISRAAIVFDQNILCLTLILAERFQVGRSKSYRVRHCRGMSHNDFRHSTNMLGRGIFSAPFLHVARICDGRARQGRPYSHGSDSSPSA
jgi:hypothetical protein